MSLEKSAGGRPSKLREAEIGREILQATLAEYVEKGGGFLVDDVARRAGVSKQALYRRWPTKLALFVEAIDKGMEAAYAEAICGLPSDPLEALRFLAWRIFDADHLFRVRMSIHIFDHASAEPQLQERLEQWTAKAFAPLLETMERFQRTRDLPVEDAKMKALMLDAISSGTGLRSAIARDNDGARREAFNETWDAFLPMLSPHAPSQICPPDP